MKTAKHHQPSAKRHLLAWPGLALGLLLGVQSPSLAAGETRPHHHEDRIAVDEGRVSLQVQPDPMGGWNVHVETEGFVFAPEHVNQAHRPGEGHAHVYINGEKVRRIYGPWFHLDPLPPGEHELRVTLNANSHAVLERDGEPLTASATLVQPPR